MDRNDGARQKSMEQLLSTLIKLLQIEAKDSVTKPITISCLRRFCNIVFKAHDRVKAKCSLHALTLFVSRGSIRWQELLDEYKSIVGVPGESSPLQSFLLEIFEWASFADAAPGVGQLSHAFYKAYTAELAHSTSSCDETPLWVAPLLSSIRRYPGSLRDFKNHVFPGLFGLDSRNFWSFLHALNLETHLGLAGGGRKRIPRYERVLDADAERMVLFNALEVGKECGMIRQDGRDFTTNAKKSLTNTVCTEDVHDAASITFRDGCVVLPTTGLAHLLSSRSPEARLAGLTLTVLSKQSTKPLTSHELHLLRLSIPQLIMDTDQNFRSEVVSIFQSLTYRLRSIFASLRRYESSLCHDGSEYQYDCTTPPFLRSNWNKHMRFVIWWRDYLQKQLKTSVSYQRHIAALKALRVLAQSGLDPRVSETRLAKRARSDIKWPFQLQVITAMGHRVLLDLLLDSFDDVRQGALNLLKAVAGKEIDYLLPLARAKSLLQQSGRVDFADGFARLIDLQATTRGACILSDGTEASKHTTEHTVETLDRLSIMQDAVIDVNNGLQVAESSFSDAVEKYPIHGQLIALR